MANNKTAISRRLSILSTEEIDSLYSLSHFTESERQNYFDLNPEERATINATRTITEGVHLLLQLGYFKAKAQFFVVSLEYVRADINHILTRYYPGRTMAEVGSLSKPTRLTQQRTILGFLGYRLCGDDMKQALVVTAQPEFTQNAIPRALQSKMLETPGQI